MLGIEVDGISHNTEEAFFKDQVRQNKLESLGVRFIRFSEGDMKYHMKDVLRSIEVAIAKIIKHDQSVKLPKGFDMDWLE